MKKLFLFALIALGASQASAVFGLKCKDGQTRSGGVCITPFMKPVKVTVTVHTKEHMGEISEAAARSAESVGATCMCECADGNCCTGNPPCGINPLAE